MQIRHGIPVSPGVAITRAVVLDAVDQPIPRRLVPSDKIAEQRERLSGALAASAKDVEELTARTAAEIGPEMAKIFDFHLAMLRDPQLVGQFEQMIDRERVTAEYAVYSAMRGLAAQFLAFENPYFHDRVKDVWDLERRILRHLLGGEGPDLSQIRQEAALVAHDLTPSQTASLDKTLIKGLATDAGGRTSHTAILAHALGIPAIVGLEDITAHVTSGDTVIIDGNRGQVIVNPDAAQLLEYRQYIEQIARIETSLGQVARQPAVTTDGTQITLLANIEFPSEIEPAVEKGAVGVGLYRTEFLFLASEIEPAEQQQLDAYLQAIKASAGRPLTIRTLDLGADKIHHHSVNYHAENNPFLGCRSIRLCLQNLSLFKTQLRAILRASAHGPIRIMFPLISNLMELRQAKMILSDVMEDLEEQGVPFAADVPVGMMIEVPSAALQAAKFSREVDFVSIGTNDLIQYTLAVDRSNERIASLYTGAHPAVIQLIRDVIRAGHRAGIDVSLCGEMAGEPEFVMLLLGLGLRTFSITPPAIPEVKKIIRSISVKQCQRVARKCMEFDSHREVHNFLREEVRRVVPDVFDGRHIAQ